MNIETSAKEYEKWLNWDDAIFYCQLLTIDNKNDWRLPTLAELEYIYKCKNDFDYSGCYWSGNEYLDYFAWTLGFGLRSRNYYTKSYRFRVRAVRTI